MLFVITLNVFVVFNKSCNVKIIHNFQQIFIVDKNTNKIRFFIIMDNKLNRRLLIEIIFNDLDLNKVKTLNNIHKIY